MSKCIGIDLGTTNSCVAVCTAGEAPRILENAEGERTTPSVVAWKDGEVLVGRPAKRQSVTNPKGTISAAKRLIGHRAKDAEIKRERELNAFDVVESESGDAWVEVEGEKMSPQQVSAHVLMKMKKTAEDFLGEKVTKAVITVPAYFNDAQRQATKDAGRIAGLEVERIINEPTAAALAYGLDKGGKDAKIAVYDLGGGTFDISIIEIGHVEGETQVEVLSTAGDTHLGGEDFDKLVIDWVAGEFKASDGVDLRQDLLALQRLKDAAESAKEELSSNQKTEISLPYITADSSGPKHLEMTLTRAKLESLTEDLVERTLGPVKRALADAKLKPGDIDEVILVGGQTRMDLVRRKVGEYFGKQPRLDVNPDEAVAAGAAIQGAVLSGDRSDVLLLDVTPLTLGIETLGGVSTPVIERNTTVPASRSQVFSTAEDNQTTVTVHVTQGERKRAGDNKSLGSFNLTDIAQAPRGLPQIEVTFDIDANGILKVSAKDKNTGRENSIEIKGSSGLSESEIEEMVEQARQHEADDKSFEELVRRRNDAEMLIHTARKLLDDLGDDAEKDEQKQVREAITALEKVLDGEDKQVLEDETRKLAELIEPLARRQGEAQAAEAAQGDGSDSAGAEGEGEVVDADFREVDEDAEGGKK